MNGKKARALRKADTRKFIGYREINIRHKTDGNISRRTSTMVKAYAK